MQPESSHCSVTGVQMKKLRDLQKKKKDTTISCHHGDINHPNVLYHARKILERNPEIAIMEIDFIGVNNNTGWHFVSSHDHDKGEILRSSPLEEWLQFVIVENERQLYIDVKARVDIMSLLGIESKFPTLFFFLYMQQQRTTIKETYKLDIRDFLFIGCQYGEIKEELKRLNNQYSEDDRWTLIDDLPLYGAYVRDAILRPLGMGFIVDWYVKSFLSEYDFSQSHLVSLDRKFFHDDAELLDLIGRVNLPPGARIVIYNFDLSHRTVTAEGFSVIMQYDYTNKQLNWLDDDQ